MSRATHPTHPDIQAKSVIARSTFPGRIFAEVSSFAQAKRLASSIPELNPNAIKLLSPEQILSPLVVVNPFVVEPQTWVRIAGARHWQGMEEIPRGHRSGSQGRDRSGPCGYSLNTLEPWGIGF